MLCANIREERISRTSICVLSGFHLMEWFQLGKHEHIGEYIYIYMSAYIYRTKERRYEINYMEIKEHNKEICEVSLKGLINKWKG